MSMMDGDWGYPGDAMDQDLMYAEMPEEYMEPGEYYGDDEYGYYYDEEDDMAVYTRIPFSDLLDQCVLPTLEQATSSLAPLLGICFAFRITYLLYGGESKEESFLHIPPRLIHIGSILVGMTATHMFFQGSMLYLVSLILLTYALLVVANRLQVVLGPLVAIVTVVYLLTCELFVVEPTEWHRIRGPQMVAAMKIISLGFDLDQNGLHQLPNIIQFAGYIFHPGTVIFGPWISFQEYANLDFHAKKKMSPWWCLKLFKSYCLAMFSVTMSTCLIPWFILDSWGKWSIAYRDAMAFRFSHYFISYTSELTATMTAIGASKSNGDIKWDLSVTKPLHMEFPRSLVEVVTNWNQPMHYWLKTYVFKTAKVWGNFPAIILTYAASSLLHGLNFQLSAVLLSLGFYSYIEYVLRAKLSKVFDACIQAKRCKDCSHTYTAKHPYVILGNIGLGLMSVFHLAYLGLMFDSSEQEEQGYTMQHTLGKWAALDYASHILAAFMFVFHLLI